MTSPFTHHDNLPIISCDHDRVLCEGRYCGCADWRRARVIAKCREIESRLNQAVIDEQTRADNEGWAVIFARAVLLAANDNAEARPTWRPQACEVVNG